jgi:three-Cys-motif partner protein
MSKNNSDFFKEKKIWSEVKDSLLGCYLEPYFSKIFYTRCPVLYIDCFAGKGKFDDGKSGSPLIALQSLENSISKFQGPHEMPRVSMKFIELNHSEPLKENLPNQHRERCEVICGKFEEHIKPILQKAKAGNPKLNVFLYIDPYGVKALNAALFDSLAKSFNTAELLINLNSFGFIREACRVMKYAFREKEADVFSDLEEYSPSIMNSVQELNEIIGNDSWRATMERYNRNEIDCYQAEKEVSHQFKTRLRETYDYVLDMPIALKKGNHPKYRMVYATNHPKGCILMADNIVQRTDYLVNDIQNAGQLSFLPQTAENVFVSEDVLVSNIKQLFNGISNFIHLDNFLAGFYNEFGVLCKSSNLTSILKTLETSRYIVVERNPSISPKTKKPLNFWAEKKGQEVKMRRNPLWKQ